MDILLGVDIGTSKLCVVAVAADGGALLAVEDAPNDTGLPGEPDSAEQDAAALLARVPALLARLHHHPEVAGARPLALGVTGQMHGVVLADSAGRPLSPLITWQDGRGNRLAGSGRSYVDEVRHRLCAAAADSGCQAASGYGAVTLLRLCEEGRLPVGATALTIQDLLVATMSGAPATDATDAASWGLFDVRHGGRWLPGAAGALGLPEELLPALRPTGSRAGTLLPGMAASTGWLPAGLPVAVAIGDNQASFVGSVPALADTVLLNLGTGGQLSVPIDHFARVEGLDTRPLLPGLWLLVGASLCGGRAYQVLERFFAAVGRECFGYADPPELYAVMHRLAETVDADGGLRADTRFSGTRLDPCARGALRGISTDNFTPAHLTRAVLAGMVEELAAFYRQAGAAGAHPTRLAASGNAVRRNPALRQEIARQLAMPVMLPPCAEEAAHGAALIGGMAIGRRLVK